MLERLLILGPNCSLDCVLVAGMHTGRGFNPKIKALIWVTKRSNPENSCYESEGNSVFELKSYIMTGQSPENGAFIQSEAQESGPKEVARFQLQGTFR